MSRRSTLAILALLLAASSRAGAEEIAYGAGGELFRVVAGTYGELFPGRTGIDPRQPVLALDATYADRHERLLVPGSDGPAVDGEASLIYEAAASRLYLLWASRAEVASSSAASLHLVSLAGDRWSEVIEVSGDPWPLPKGPLRLAINRDSYATQKRTVLHLLWWEQGAVEEEVYYTPIVLLDGIFLGWNPVVRLNDLDRRPGAEETANDSAPFYQAASLAPGENGQSVVLAVPRRLTRRLLTFEVRLLPAGLVRVADRARHQIGGFGHRHQQRLTVNLANDLGAYVLTLPSELHVGVLSYLAEAARAAVLDHGETYNVSELDGIAQEVWDRLLEAGASLAGNEFEQSPRLGCSLLHLGATADSPIAESLHQIEICLASDRPAPRVGPGVVELIVAKNGHDALVLWDGANELGYRLSTDQGWTETRSATLSTAVTRSAAKRYLRQLIRTD